LYVAATRAGDELVIGMAYNPNSRSPWLPFHEWLNERGIPLLLPPAGAAERRVLQRPAADIQAEIATVGQARAAAAVATYRAAPVTVRKGLIAAADAEPGRLPPQPDAGEPPDAPAAADAASGDAVSLPGSSPELGRARRERGTEWGSIVHEALEAALRDPGEERLRALCRGWLIAAERPMDAAGEPEELAELLALVRAVRAARVWRQAQAAEARLSEVPFAIALSAAEYAALAGGGVPAADAVPLEIIDGRIDLAFREADGWTIVDYKSDAEGAEIPAELMHRYRTQVQLYARIWERLTGELVKERLLLFTAGVRPAVVAVS
jgi:ATP-dependent exoDNAse (exonuclease V) beta subunit